MHAKLLSLNTISMLSLLYGGTSVAQDRMPWVPTIETAQQMATQQNQLVLLHFWSPTCSPCVQLEQTVFNDPNVAQSLARDYVPVKINVDQYPATARQYAVDQLPLDVVMTPNGQILHRSVSPLTASHYVAQYQRIVASRRHAGTMMLANNANTTSVFQPIAGQAHQSMPNHGRQPGPNQTSVAWPANGNSTYANRPKQNVPDPKMHEVGANPTSWNPPLGPTASGGESRYYGGLPSSSHTLAVPPTTLPQAGPYGPQPNAPMSSQYANQNQAHRYQNPPNFDNRFSEVPANLTERYTQNPAVSSQLRIEAQTTQGAGPSPTASPPENPQMGIDGYCTVTLSEQSRWQLGDARWGAIHRGRTYLFIGQAEQQRFLSNPDFYAPMLSGHDPVLYIEQGKLVAGFRQHGIFFRQQIYLFSSEDTLRRFSEAAENFHSAAFQAMRQSGAAPRR